MLKKFNLKIGKKYLINIKDLIASNLTSRSSLAGLPDTSEILEKSEVSLNLDGGVINIPVSVLIPRLLPLPKIVFPASIEFGIFGKSAKAIDITINAVTIETLDESICVETLINVVPINSVEAAISLSEAINPF